MTLLEFSPQSDRKHVPSSRLTRRGRSIDLSPEYVPGVKDLPKADLLAPEYNSLAVGYRLHAVCEVVLPHIVSGCTVYPER